MSSENPPRPPQKLLSGAAGRVQRVIRMGKAAFQITDHARWSRNVSEPPSWDQRNLTVVAMIEPDSSVLDLGAGAQTLRQHLPADCRYTPCDLVRSSPDCIVCDFNQGQYPPEDLYFDHVVCSGLLEYLRRPRQFLERIAGYGDSLIISYSPLQEAPRDKLWRLDQGWINHLTQEQLETLFSDLGYVTMERRQWSEQLLYELKPAHVASRKPPPN